MNIDFALEVLEATLAGIREERGQQWPLPMSEDQVDTIWDCDWEDEVCPVCGQDMDRHDNRTITRCANAR
jgi:hypothetical protein